MRCTASLIALCLFTATAVHAFNYRDLRTAPIAWFNDKDIQMMTDAFNKAMDDNADGASIDWSNDKTGNHGRVTPLDTSQEDAGTCRRVKIENYAGANHGVTQLRFCRKGDEAWQVTE